MGAFDFEERFFAGLAEPGFAEVAQALHVAINAWPVDELDAVNADDGVADFEFGRGLIRGRVDDNARDAIAGRDRLGLDAEATDRGTSGGRGAAAGDTGMRTVELAEEHLDDFVELGGRSGLHREGEV